MDGYIVKNRQETCSLIKSMIGEQRIIVARYSDGEANIFRGRKGVDLKCGNEDSATIRDLLLNAIQDKRQLVCINELKKNNIKKNDRWVKVQRELAIAGDHDTYGGANWNIYDFQNENLVLPHLFNGKVLIVSGHASKIEEAFRTKGKNVEVYQTKLQAASADYYKCVRDLKGKAAVNKYDNILFSCGPIGKVFIVDLIDVCSSNLIDIGSLINAIIDGVLYFDRRTIKSWNMNWTDKKDIKKLTDTFFNKVSHEGNK